MAERDRVPRESYLHSCQLLLPVLKLDLPKQHEKRPQSRIPHIVRSNTQLAMAKHVDSAIMRQASYVQDVVHPEPIEEHLGISALSCCQYT